MTTGSVGLNTFNFVIPTKDLKPTTRSEGKCFYAHPFLIFSFDFVSKIKFITFFHSICFVFLILKLNIFKIKLPSTITPSTPPSLVTNLSHPPLIPPLTGGNGPGPLPLGTTPGRHPGEARLLLLFFTSLGATPVKA